MRAYKENWNFVYITRVWRWYFKIKQIFITEKIIKIWELKSFLKKRKIHLNKKYYDNLL